MMAHSVAPNRALNLRSAFALSLKVLHCTIDGTSKVHTPSHAASATTAQDQRSNDDASRAVVIYDKSIAATAQAQVPQRDLVPISSGATITKASESSATSGVKRPRALSDHDSEQHYTRKRISVGPMFQHPMSDESLQSIETRDLRMTTMHSTRLDLLRWKSSPFTLELVGDNLYCPRLVIKPNTLLSRVLPPASYPLDSAILHILRNRNSGKSMSCEANWVLTVYNHLRQIDFSDVNITLLDPFLFDSSDHSTIEKKAFHEQLGDWIQLVDLNRTSMIDVNYAQLQIYESILIGTSLRIHRLQSGSNPPPIRKMLYQVSFTQAR